MGQLRREVWEKWRRLIGEQARSGQTVIAFCRQRGVSKPQFFAWRKRLRQADEKGFVAVAVVPAAAPAREQALEVRLGSGLRIVVEPGFDAAHLRAVVAALEGRV